MRERSFGGGMGNRWQLILKVGGLLSGLGLFLLLGPFSAVIVVVAVAVMPFCEATAPKWSPVSLADGESIGLCPADSGGVIERWLDSLAAHKDELLGLVICGALSFLLGPFVAVVFLFMVPQLMRLGEDAREPSLFPAE